MITHFDYEKIERMRRNMQVALGMSMGVYDSQGRSISRYQKAVRSHLCFYMRTINAEFDEKCKKCDQDACLECHKTGKMTIYRCHIGLMELITPIRCDGILVGYGITGQVLLLDDYENNRRRVTENMRAYGMEDYLIDNLLGYQKELTQRKLLSIGEILSDCLAALWLREGITVSADNMISRINGFIMDNLANELSISSICDTFRISKTKLANIAQESYGTSLGKHISNLRVKEGQRLLENTDLTIYDIAARVGIPDYNYFTKVFKTATGMTPKEYRKQCSCKAKNREKCSVDLEC